MLDWMLAAAATSNIKLWEISLSSSAFVFDSKIHFYELAGNLFSAFFLHCVDFLIFARLPIIVLVSASILYVDIASHTHSFQNICVRKSLNFSTIIHATFFWFSFATFIFSISLFLWQAQNYLQATLQPSAKEILEAIRAIFLQVRIHCDISAPLTKENE